MKLITWGSNTAALVGSAMLLVNVTTLWEPHVGPSWGAVMVGLSLVIVKGITVIFTYKEDD